MRFSSSCAGLPRRACGLFVGWRPLALALHLRALSVFPYTLFAQMALFPLERPNERTRKRPFSRLLARFSSLVVNRASGFQHRSAKLRSEGIIQKLALLYRERCADGARARG